MKTRLTLTFYILLWMFGSTFSQEEQSVIAPPAAGANEPEWSRYVARQWGLNPEEVCEYLLPEGSRVDVITNDTAWEVEWAYNHYEAVGQALHYSIWSGRKPGIVLLMRSGIADDRALFRTKTICIKYDIKLRVVKVSTGEISDD